MKTLLCLYVIFSSLLTDGQVFPDYCVFLLKGNITIDHAKVKNSKLKQGEFITQGDVIHVPNNAELQLFTKGGNFLILNIPGTYSTVDIRNKITKKPIPSVTSTYLQLVYQQILDPNYDHSKRKQNSVGASYGGTSRGAKCIEMLFPIEGSKIAGRLLKYTWNSGNMHPPFTITIYDSNKVKIKSFVSQNSSKMISIDSFTTYKRGKFYWDVSGINGICKSSSLISYYINSKENQDKRVMMISRNYENTSLIEELVLAANLEKEGFITEALNKYDILNKKYKGNIVLKKSYEAFLRKYGF